MAAPISDVDDDEIGVGVLGIVSYSSSDNEDVVGNNIGAAEP
jgi:hypothetical protein